MTEQFTEEDLETLDNKARDIFFDSTLEGYVICGMYTVIVDGAAYIYSHIGGAFYLTIPTPYYFLTADEAFPAAEIIWNKPISNVIDIGSAIEEAKKLTAAWRQKTREPQLELTPAPRMRASRKLGGL